MSDITDFLKKHVWAAIVTTLAGSGVLGTALGSGVTYYFTLQQNRAERFENSLMTEYQAAETSKRELYAAIDKFTAALATGKRPDPALIDEMNGKLLDLHQRFDVFSLGLQPEDQAKLAMLKASLANMKLEVARAKTKDDLPYFAGSLAQFESAYKAARPIVEKKIGTPNRLLTG